MNFEISKNIILENLNNVGRALSNRNIIPVINGILFELTDEGLNLTATDNEIAIKTLIPKDKINIITSNGNCVLYGRVLLDIIRKLPDELLKFEEVDGGKVIISTSTSKFSLNIFNYKDFPSVKFSLVNKPILLTACDFKTIINQTVFATSTQESKPILTGINLKIQGNLLECIATDSYRLAKKQFCLDNIIDTNVNIVIPSRNINEFVRMLDTDDEKIEIHPFSNKIMLKYKNYYFQSSLLNGTYPNTDSLVPSNFEIIYKLNLEEFYSIIDRASILAQAKDKNIVTLETKSNKLILTSSSLELGKIEETMNIEVIKGNDLKISFSAKYMMEALKSFTSDEISLYIIGDIKPIIIKEEDNSSLIQLIVPIKTY